MAGRGTLGAQEQIEGTYSVVAVYEGEPHTLIGARSGGGGLVVGLGKNENLLASDVPALLAHTRRVFYLEDNEMVTLKTDGVELIGVLDGKIRKISKFLKLNGVWSRRKRAGYPTLLLSVNSRNSPGPWRTPSPAVWTPGPGKWLWKASFGTRLT